MVTIKTELTALQVFLARLRAAHMDRLHTGAAAAFMAVRRQALRHLEQVQMEIQAVAVVALPALLDILRDNQAALAASLYLPFTTLSQETPRLMGRQLALQ